MRNLSILVLITGLLVSCTGFFGVRGNGDILSENRTAFLGNTAFSKVSINGVGTVQLVQGNTYSLQVNADSNLLEYITTELVNDTLELSIQHGISIAGYSKLEYVIILPVLSRLDSSGTAAINTIGIFNGDSFELNNSGTSTISITGYYTQVKSGNSGTGNITLTGAANAFDYSSSGVGDLNAFDFSINNAIISMSGVGNAKVFVNSRLSVNISGVGSVTYKGNPVVTGNISGLGSLIHSF